MAPVGAALSVKSIAAMSAKVLMTLVGMARALMICTTGRNSAESQAARKPAAS